MSSITGPSGTQSTQGVYSDDTIRTNQTAQSSVTPPSSKTSGTAPSASVPTLPAPSNSNLSLESLMSAIGYEGRRLACQAGVNSLEGKAKDQKEVNAKELEEIKTQLEEMAKRSVLNGFLKAFQIIGVIVGAIASVASIVAGAITGNPLLIAAGVMGAIATVDGVISLASDGKYSMSAGFTELGKACGMSDEDAAWFGMAMQMVFMVATVAVSLGAGFANAGAGAAQTAAGAAQSATTATTTLANTATQVASETINKTLNIFLTAQKIASLASAGTTMATGSASIGRAVIDYDIAQTKINMKELEAILERLRASMDMEKALVESELQRANNLLESVSGIVEDANATQVAILTSSPTFA